MSYDMSGMEKHWGKFLHLSLDWAKITYWIFYHNIKYFKIPNALNAKFTLAILVEHYKYNFKKMNILQAVINTFVLPIMVLK